MATAADLENELVLHLQPTIRHVASRLAKTPPDTASLASSGFVGFTRVKALRMAQHINTKFLVAEMDHGVFYVEQSGECFNVFLLFW